MSSRHKDIIHGLKATRLWLKNAEESFDSKNDVQAHLHLLLAKAELQRVQESKGCLAVWRKLFVMRQVAALGLAGVIAVLGFGGWLVWQHSDGGKMAAMPLQQEQSREIPPVQMEQKSAVIPSQPPAGGGSTVTAGAAAPPAAVRTPAAEQVKPTEQVAVVKQEEMQKIIRAAGKSLRGQ